MHAAAKLVLLFSITASILYWTDGKAQETSASNSPVIDDALPRESTESVLDTTIVTSAPSNPGMTFSSPVTGVSAPTVTTLDADVEAGKLETLLGVAPSASSGRASGEDLAQRSFLRRGELLEVVPGMIVTQHSGGGKANQYFLRGYNLDHGTDFAIFVDNMPVNNRTHGHGQGYADINFLIPELVEELEYVKGPYFSRFGDFSTAGAARFRLYRELPEGIASFSIGTDNYYRGLLADSVKAGNGIATYALEYNSYDGPWVNPDDLGRTNGFFRYAVGNDDDFLSFTLMGFDSSWNATDQIPSRAVANGIFDRFGAVDPSAGGESYRYSFSTDFKKTSDSGVTVGSIYTGAYQLDLYSNFTYFLDDTVNGDQFNQFDDRWFAGASLDHTFNPVSLLDRENVFSVGLQTHHDFIDGVGLYNTAQRQRLSTVREDTVYESSFSGYGSVETTWNSWLRSQAGLRGDLYYFDVDSRTLDANSGDDWAGIVSPKAGLVFGPWNDTEFYLNGGLGFHSNDARGVTITEDPGAPGTPVDAVPPLVRTKGAEVGVRSLLAPNLNSTLSVWYLYSDSELVYVGDAGNVEAGDASERYGVEWSNYWRHEPWLMIDTEFTATESRFLASGDEIENSVPLSAAGGITVGEEYGPYASLRARYFSPRPLNGDGSVKSQDAFQLNGRVGYRHTSNWEFTCEVINLLDAQDNDIEYFYESQLPTEFVGVEDIHFHPYEPRQVRFTVTRRW